MKPIGTERFGAAHFTFPWSLSFLCWGRVLSVVWRLLDRHSTFLPRRDDPQYIRVYSRVFRVIRGPRKDRAGAIHSEKQNKKQFEQQYNK